MAGINVPIGEGHLTAAVFGVGFQLTFVNVPVLVQKRPKALRLGWFRVGIEVQGFLGDFLFAH